MRKVKRVVGMIIAVMMMGLTACGSVTIDFGDAESFEAALNNGENLEGKVVQFIAGEFHPDSALGYDVWAGENLNFVSSRHPNVAQGDKVIAKVSTIENVMGSWVITYEKIDKGEVNDNTRFSNGTSSVADSETLNSETNGTIVVENKAGVNSDSGSNSSGSSGIVVNSENTQNEVDSLFEEGNEEPDCEYTDAKIVAFKGYSGPEVSAYVAIKNNNDYPISFEDVCIDYEDNDGKLLATDPYARCVPNAIKPGQTGYIYSYYFDITGVDTSNGFTFKPDGKIVRAKNFYEMEVSDVSASTNDFMDVKVIGRGTNNTGSDRIPDIGAIFYDKEGNIMGFCYGCESFDNGQTKSFEISGDLLSEDYDKANLDHVEVYIQGDSWY